MVEQGKIKWTDMLEVQKGMDDREWGGYACFFKDRTLDVTKRLKAVRLR